MITSFPNSLRILHVDDDQDFAELTCEFLEQENDRFTVETATSAGDGLERLANEEFDCVVSDYEMPRQNGIEFLEAVRAENPDLPFILFTGKGSEEVASDAISAGVTDYLQKEGGTDQYTVLANRITNAVEHYRSRQLVDRSETRLQKIVDSLPHHLYVVDENEQFLLVNEALADFHDSSVEAIESADVTAVLDDHVAEALRANIADVLSSDSSKRISAIEISDSSGETRIFQSRLLPYNITEADTRAVLGIAVDITERRERESELEQTRERMQLALEQTDSVIFEIDCDTDAVIRHGAYHEFFDVEPEETPTWREHLGRAVHPDDRDRFHQFYRQLVSGGREAGELEYRTNPEMGSVRWIRDSAFSKTGSDTASRQVIGVARDITEYKERERELEQYEAYLEESNDIITVLDESGTIQYQSPSVTRILGYEPDKLLDENGFELVHPDDTDELSEMFADLVSEPGSTVTSEARFRTADDEWRWLEVRGQNHLDHPVIGGIVTNNRDITDRKGYERDLERTNALLSTLFETLPVGVLAEDESRNVLSVNERLLELFEIAGTPDEIIGVDCERMAEDVREILDSPDEFTDRIGALVDNREPVWDERLHLEDGRTFDRRYEPIELPAGEGHLWVYSDITDRVTREKRLEALNETTRDLMAAETPREVAEIGAEAARDILNMNANAVHLYDDDRSALVPVAVTDVGRELVGDPPAFTDGDSIAWRVYESGDPLALDDVHTDPDIYNPKSSAQSELYLPIGERGLLIASSETAAAFDQEDIVIGEILASNIATALDQVEQTERLRERERELTRQNDRLEEFANVVSHDLRNPLRVAEGRLQLAQEECESEHLASLEMALDRIDTLITDLLTLAREGEEIQELESVDLAALIERCWHNVETANTTLEIRTAQTVQADHSRLQQLFENLIRNAVEHGGKGVTVTVGDTEDGFYIADDGPGISPDEQKSVFEAGYSTTQDGTGFGLAIVKEIADAHEWDISISNSDAGGLRVDITGVQRS